MRALVEKPPFYSHPNLSIQLNFFKFFKQELAVDLGTANTLIMVDDQVIVDEPSIIAVDRRTGNTIAVGHRAMQMHEKTHENIKTIRPLKDGVIADFQAAEAMIESMIRMVGKKSNFFRAALPKWRSGPYSTPPTTWTAKKRT